MVLSLLRGEEETLRRLSELDETNLRMLMRAAGDLKVLPQVLELAAVFVPSELRPTVAAAQLDAKGKVRKHLSVIDNLERDAKEHGLRFVVFKGLAAALAYYGDVSARQVGDIDIMVDAPDLVRCDYVLRSAGFVQPDYETASRFSDKRVAHYVQSRSRGSIPYPMRRRAHDPQLAPYYFPDANVKVEVHDGMFHIPRGYTAKMMWRAERVEVDGVQFRVPCVEDALFVLLATAYENSETVYGCIDGDINLRDYCDLRAFLARNEKRIDWRKTQDLIDGLGMSRIASAVAENYRDVFEVPAGMLAATFGEGHDPSRCMGPLSERVLDRSKAVRAASRLFRGDLGGAISGVDAGYMLGLWNPVENRPGIDVTFRVRLEEGLPMLEWCIPSFMEHDLDMLGFQLGIVPPDDNGCLELLIGFATAEGGRRAFWRKSSRPSLMLSPHRAEGKLPFDIREEGERLVVSIRLEGAPGDVVLDSCAGTGLSTAALDGGERDGGHSRCVGLIPMVFARSSASSWHSLNCSDEGLVSPRPLYPAARV